MCSRTVRELYREYHNLDVGYYTIGPCEAGPGRLDPGTDTMSFLRLALAGRAITGLPITPEVAEPVEAVQAAYAQAMTVKNGVFEVALTNRGGVATCGSPRSRADAGPGAGRSDR